MAREVEEKLRLGLGWMDTPPYEEGQQLRAESTTAPYCVTRQHDTYTQAAIEIMLSLKDYQREGALAALRSHVQNLTPPRDGQALPMAA